MSFLKGEDLRVGYSNKIVVDNINFNLDKGEILCLLGPNGSGKSTIIRTIIDSLELLGGKISLLDRDLNLLTYKERAKKMSVVLTERVEAEIMTGYEIVATGRYPYTNYLGRLETKDKLIIEESLHIVNGSELAKKEFSHLSDGEKQRLMIARAICQESEIMVLDEPTSFLDIKYKIDLLDILNTLANKKKKTIILSLHEIDLVSKIADKVLLIKNGEIFKYGSPETVITDKNIEEAYDLKEGMFSTKLGSLELINKTKNKAKVFVIGGEGRGIPIYRALKRENIGFNTGIIFKNDLDYLVGKSLAEKIVLEEAFKNISKENMDIAKGLIDRADYIIDSGVNLEGINQGNKDLLNYSKVNKKIIYSLRDESFKGFITKDNIKDIITCIK